MNDEKDCAECIAHNGLCAFHARHIAQLAQINWKKIQGETIVHETAEDADAARERQEAERKAAEESREYRRNLEAPETTARRTFRAMRGEFTGRNRAKKAA